MLAKPDLLSSMLCYWGKLGASSDNVATVAGRNNRRRSNEEQSREETSAKITENLESLAQNANEREIQASHEYWLKLFEKYHDLPHSSPLKQVYKTAVKDAYAQYAKLSGITVANDAGDGSGGEWRQH